MYRKVIPAVIFSAVMVLFFISPLYASDDYTLTMGVCRLEFTDGGEAAIASGISSRFYETVSNVEEHSLEIEEISRIKAAEKDLQINAAIVSLEKLYADRDGLIFEVGTDDLADALAEKKAAIDEKISEIERLKEERAESLIQSASIKPAVAELIMSEPEDGLIFNRVPGSIEESASLYGLDLLVYGFIETIDEYEYVEVRLWNDILKKDSYVWRTALSSDTVNELINPGLNGIKTAVYGREWAELSISGPDNSMIFVNGVFTGIGGINSIPVTPGKTDIELRKAGSKGLRESIEIPAGGLTELVYEMEEVKPGYVIVQTWPAGADVYLDSVWSGTSPLKISIENEVSAVRILKDGYEEQNFFFEKNSEKILNLNLKPVISERDEWIPGERTRFYTSLGSFMLSVPMTALFSSMLDQSASAYNREYEENGDLNVAELMRLFNLNRAEYGMYVASVGLNVFLLLDTIIQAVEYVSSVDYFSE